MKAGAEPTITTTSSDEPSRKCGCFTPLFMCIFDRNKDGKVELGEVVAVAQEVGTVVQPAITAIGDGKKKKNRH